MAVEAVAWNIQDAFSDGVRTKGVLGVVRDLHPDVAVFPEAWREGQEHLLDHIWQDFDRAGYQAIGALYQDDDGRQNRHGILAIVRPEVVYAPSSITRWAGRNAVRLWLRDPASNAELPFDGIHLDDRTETRRLAQTRALLADDRSSWPRIIAGDFNALHYRDPRARLLRVARPLARLLAAPDHQADPNQPKLRRFASVAARGSDMARGTTMMLFEDAGMHDVDDHKYQGTRGKFNLDHMLYRYIVPSRKRLYNNPCLSDHAALYTRFLTLPGRYRDA